LHDHEARMTLVKMQKRARVSLEDAGERRGRDAAQKRSTNEKAGGVEGKRGEPAKR